MITKISGGKIIAENEILSGYDLYIEDGKILSLSPSPLPFDKEIDAKGLYVSAGFIDLHLHGGADADFSEGNLSGNLAAANFHFKNGTTSLFPTTLSQDIESLKKALEALRETMASKELLPNILGVHLEGPYFSLKQCGAQNTDFITPPKKEDYTDILEKYSDIIARWSFAPELSGSLEFVDALSEHNVISSIGHSDAIYNDVLKVYNKGCKLITHFFSCTSTITREKGFRRLGVTECGYLFDDIAVEAIADGCHIPKELFKMLYKIKGSDNICLVTDAINCAGSEKTVSSSGGVPCKIKNGVACLLDESAFAGSIATANSLIRFCYKEVGIGLCEAVKMMTVNPARVMGIKNKGSLKEGFDADIVLFDDDINAKTVIVGGRVF